MRRPIIAANWKMYKTVDEALDFAAEIKGLLGDDTDDVEAIICPPFTALPALADFIRSEVPPFALGAQNMYWEAEGAFTGEIAPSMLRDLGVEYVILGHSERRQYFGETNDVVNRKVKAAFSSGLTPIMCVGETLEQREAGATAALLQDQITEGLDDIAPARVSEMVIAYEPIWAIGTGRTATPEDANDAIRHIRAVIASRLDPATAAAVRIQYGGSVKPDNIAALMDEPEIDGALVGGASLDPESFAAIVRFR